MIGWIDRDVCARSGGRGRLARAGAALLAGALLVSACSGDDGVDTVGVETTAAAPAGTGADGQQADDEMDAETAATLEVPGADTAPPTSTDPPRPESGPDAIPTTLPPEVTTTTVAAVPLPEPDAVGRIVSLSPTHTETLFALGVGDAVIAVDPESNYPEAAIALQDQSLSNQLANVDAVTALDPDLVVLGDDPTNMARRLGEAGIANWVGGQPSDVEAAFAQILDIGRLVGRSAEAEALVGSMRDELVRLREGLPPAGTLTYFHEIDPSLFTVAPGTFLDSAYGALGLVSVAPTGGADTVVQVAPDALIAADPDVIVLADASCCGANPDNVASRSGWAEVSAVRTGAIVVLGDGLADRWGPRLLEFWRAVAAGANAAT